MIGKDQMTKKETDLKATKEVDTQDLAPDQEIETVKARVFLKVFRDHILKKRKCQLNLTKKSKKKKKIARKPKISIKKRIIKKKTLNLAITKN